MKVKERLRHLTIQAFCSSRAELRATLKNSQSQAKLQTAAEWSRPLTEGLLCVVPFGSMTNPSPPFLGLPSVAVSLEMLGKFAVTAGSSLMYVYTAELYPTVLRNTGTGACSVLSRVGSSVAPFLFKLSE